MKELLILQIKDSVLSTQLQSIEQQKQNFKEKNNLSDIRSDAEININHKLYMIQSYLIQYLKEIY